MEMDPRLREAAETGNIDALHVLIGDDPYILERIDQVPFIQTPLHIAADKGHVSFAMEMMNLKPSFAKKLNPNGFSPMHMALRTEQTKLVLRLLKTDKDLVRVKGWEGMTPFHYVVTTGNSRLLVNFLEACPECIEDVTVRDETALHLALKQDQIEAFSLLIGWLQRTRQTHGSVFSFEKKMANWKDDQDNTLLHIAAKKNQHEALKLLLDSQLWLHVKAKDSEGLTALEIIKDANRRNVNISMSDEVDTKIKRLKDKVTFERIRVMGDRTRLSMSVDMINTMLVIMALVITAIYQSSLSPPGSVWQDNDTDTSPPPSHHMSNKNIFSTSISIFGNSSGKAGKTIMNPHMYGLFWFLNLATFGLADLVTVFLLSSFHLFLLLAVPLYILVICYFCSMAILAPTLAWAYVNLFFVLLFGFFPFLLLFALLILSKSIRQTIAEIRYRTRMRKALGMNFRGPWTFMFYSQYILDGIFSIWMPSA
ncbi:ankyrin repeat-containing protein BDA1-like isoform X2 [Hibiscus syriacus]|nr:ankyrin repeat-containing protein BDA1-like isoform X2 [Hibiscus syriacus]XP_039071961.1 ankyrin repeat-containing protein BDA1-like isoform X2 [Hibiscus syriacus]